MTPKQKLRLYAFIGFMTPMAKDLGAAAAKGEMPSKLAFLAMISACILEAALMLKAAASDPNGGSKILPPTENTETKKDTIV